MHFASRSIRAAVWLAWLPLNPPKIRSQVALELGPKDWFNPAAGIQLGEEW